MAKLPFPAAKMTRIPFSMASITSTAKDMSASSGPPVGGYWLTLHHELVMICGLRALALRNAVPRASKLPAESVLRMGWSLAAGATANIFDDWAVPWPKGSVLGLVPGTATIGVLIWYPLAVKYG